MKVIKLDFPHNLDRNDLPQTVLAIGYFDGVHLGHQEVILKAKRLAEEQGLSSAVMTFDPHPSVVLGKNKQQIQYITPLNEKVKILQDMGIDFLFLVRFTARFANLLPQEFIDQYIIGLHVKHVVAGFDFTYGRMGKGTMETIPFHSRKEFTFTVVPKYTEGGGKVSSTRIRNLLKEGKMAELRPLLGRYYTTTGTVVHGDKRGRTIGFPTANVDVNDQYLLPPLGVYAVRIEVSGQWYQGVCNVGYKPTFNQEASRPTVEVHIFEFDQDIYGEKVTVEWHLYLRKEQKFSGVEELVGQIKRDKQNALGYFKNRQNS